MAHAVYGREFHTTHGPAIAAAVAGALTSAALRILWLCMAAWERGSGIGELGLGLRVAVSAGVLGGACGMLLGALVVTIVRRARMTGWPFRLCYGAVLGAAVAGLIGVSWNLIPFYALWNNQMRQLAATTFWKELILFGISSALLGAVCGAVAVWWDGRSRRARHASSG
jgi:hypothetical protein